jgi:hypothetical protein
MCFAKLDSPDDAMLSARLGRAKRVSPSGTFRQSSPHSHRVREAWFNRTGSRHVARPTYMGYTIIAPVSYLGRGGLQRTYASDFATVRRLESPVDRSR